MNNGYLVTVWDGSKIFVSTQELYGEEEAPNQVEKAFASIQYRVDENTSKFLLRANYRYI